jgi:hypothetical protein
LDRWTPFTIAITFRETIRVPERSIIAQHSQGTDAGYNGWDLTIADGYVESRLYRVWPGNGIGIRTVGPIPANRWQQLTARYDGSSDAAGLKLYLDGELLPSVVLRNTIVKMANVNVGHGGQLAIGHRFRSRGLAGGEIDEVRFFGRALTATEIQHLATGSALEVTAEYYLSAIDDKLRKTAAALVDANRNWVMAEEPIHEVPIMRETAEPVAAYVLPRGQYDAPNEDANRVVRETFSRIGPSFPEDAPRDRMGLARWTTHPDHPLTARVFVNRIWSNFFGDGLVRTPEDFGFQGAPPDNPALLDWLARDFVSTGWDIKRLCKLISLSATYRQDSADRELATRSVDPENRWLARGPSQRLGAEQIRDLALFSSGLLNSEIGGPPVSPYQPGGDLWTESNSMSPPYRQSVGVSLYRRSLYSVWKRTAPLPNMIALDATSREVCTVRRSHTNTPLQALVLLNDIQFVEASRKAAESIISEDSNDVNRLETAFMRFTGRTPDESELDLLQGLLVQEREYYGRHPDHAVELIGQGDSEVGDIDPQQLAAWTMVCQAILNLDATIWKR